MEARSQLTTEDLVLDSRAQTLHKAIVKLPSCGDRYAQGKGGRERERREKLQ